MSFDIITDTSANLPGDVIAAHGIKVIPLTFTINNGGSSVVMTPESYDGHAFFDSMRAGAVVTTSQVNPGNYAELFEQSLSEGRDVLYVAMSSGISGSFNSAGIAARELEEKYPGRRIRLVDTIGASLGEGLLVLKASDMRDAGEDIEKVYKTLDAERHTMYNVFTVDELKYLRRTGRLSNASAIIGTVLQIKPLLKGDPNGKIVSFVKIRGRKKAIETLAKKYAELADRPEEHIIGIAHADCEEDADELISLINGIKPPKGIMKVMYEPVTGSHVGPGTLALFFPAVKGCRER